MEVIDGNDGVLAAGIAVAATMQLFVCTLFDKPPASCCITHERTYLLSPSRKEERRRKENKGERRKEKGVPDRGNTKQPFVETILRN